MDQMVKDPPASEGDAGGARFDSWVGKIPWRRKSTNSSTSHPHGCFPNSTLSFPDGTRSPSPKGPSCFLQRFSHPIFKQSFSLRPHLIYHSNQNLLFLYLNTILCSKILCMPIKSSETAPFCFSFFP